MVQPDIAAMRPELRLELHGAPYQAMQHRSGSEAEAGPVTIDGKLETVRIVVSPVFRDLDTSRGMILVVFEATNAEEPRRSRVREIERTAEPIARQLEEELMRLKARLRTHIEQHELQCSRKS
jgi:two-component system CheB/CheR fusion protein